MKTIVLALLSVLGIILILLGDRFSVIGVVVFVAIAGILLEKRG